MRKILLFLMTMVTIHATTPTYENVTRLYVATFDRTPDVAGLKYWVNDSGLDLEDIARSFFDQPETKAKYYPDGTIYLSSFIDEIYANLFDRAPDTSGKEYWTDYIMAGGFNRVSVFILAVINGAQGNDATILGDKTKYAYDAIKDQLEDEPTDATQCHSRGTGSFWIGDKELGVYCSYYSNGQLQVESPYAHGVQHGEKWVYFESGNKKTKSVYWNGHLIEQRWWYESGTMWSCKYYDTDFNYTGSCMP